MEQRRITHPIDGNTSAFLKTCTETNGEFTLCEMEGILQLYQKTVQKF